MLSVFLSHSSKDKPFVRELAEFLRRERDIKVWLDEGEIAPTENIVGAIDQGLEADFLILILSPDSVQSAWVREEWMSALWQQTNSGTERLVTVLHRDCKIPNLLANKKLFDLRTNQPHGFRSILTFLQTQRPVPPQRANRLDTRNPHFVGREPELAALRERLSHEGAVVSICETPGQGKTALALEFAHRYQRDFESVYWLSCQSQNLASIATDLMRKLNLELTADLPVIIEELKDVCSQKRCLLILDNVDEESPGQLIPGGAASVLVTTRYPNLKFLRFHAHQRLPVFTEDQCFEFFRRVLDNTEVTENESACKNLFRRLGYLPIGIVVSAGLILYDAHYTIASLSANPPRDVYALISEAVDALDPAPRRLLAAMSACAPEGFALDLAAEIGGFDTAASLDALQQLLSRSLVEELSRSGRRYRLHGMVREAACDESLSPVHAEAVRARFEKWENNWKQCEQSLPDFHLALDWYLRDSQNQEHSDAAGSLAYSGFSLTLRVGRLAESFGICEQMKSAASAEDQRGALQASLGNQALILKAWGRLEEALALHKKEEAICEELGNRDGLQACYGNQALILQDWGRLEEALALHKKKEAICEELGNRDGLQITYGNQALILQAWGRLEEALALHKKKEAICEELGNRDGMQACYGNQALILQAWGRLEEALALLKKQEAICKELGNRDGLSISYGNQALILKAWGRLEEALALHKEEEAICEELGNRDGLSISYGNQALILRTQGRLEEALALLKKQEAICLALNKKSGLAYCYWNWGRLDREMGDLAAGQEKLSQALKLFTELGMPRERDAVADELTKRQSAGTA